MTPYSREFLAQIRQLQPEGYVSHIPQKTGEELRQLFDESSALIHFAMEESFGLVVAEALARNLKVITPPVGGVVDIAEGVPGAEVLERDDWQTLRLRISNWIAARVPKTHGRGRNHALAV